MVITGREIDAEEGRRIGMVNHVVADCGIGCASRAPVRRTVLHWAATLCKPTKSFYRFAETARPEANADHAVNLIANAIHSKGNVG